MSRRGFAYTVAALLTVADRYVALAVPAYGAASAPFVPALIAVDTLVAAALYGLWGGIGTGIAATALCLAVALIDPALRESMGLDDRRSTPFALELAVAIVGLGAALGRLRDVSARSRRQIGALGDRERRFRALTETVSDVIAIFDRHGRATYTSGSHGPLLGREAGDLQGQLASYVYGADGIDEALAECANGRTSGRLEMRARHRDGTLRVLDVVYRNSLEDSAIRGIVVSGRDVSERKAVENELARQAHFDQLTGLPNRRHLREQLELEVQTARQTAAALSVMFIDLDGFKYVNDVLGHEWGDTLLELVASRLRTRLRDNDMVARLGGDEFAIVLPGFAAVEASAVAERLSASLTVPYTLKNQTVVVGASIGIAVMSPASDAQTLLRQADIAMYGAKRRRSGVRLFSPADDEQVAFRLMTASSLHEAIAEDRLLLHFQPQLSLHREGTASRVVGAEALLRWQHPERGLLLPGAFIPIAEELGMMGRVTEWVLRSALRQLKRWQRAGYDLRLSVNLSAQDLRDPRLGDTLTRLLTAYDIAPSALCLELTETAVTADLDRALEFLARLSALGVRISIDDFGTGYSSLAHLKRFPVDELKIDKSFVIGMQTDDDDAAIVASTIELAHRLQVDVVVEGIENAWTLDAVAQLGADVGQGEAIGRPMSVEAFDAWLASEALPAAAPAVELLR